LGLFSKLDQQGHGARRNTLLRWAMMGSASSKVTGLALQAIAIPLVYHSLGPHQFALYLLLTAALSSIGLAQMGAGPGLTQGIAHANAAQRRDHEAALLNAGFRLTLLGALVGAVVIVSIIHLVSPERLFGVAFATDRAEIIQVANVCIVVLMAQMIAGVVDSALAGYQEQVLSSIASMTANAVSVVLLLIVCNHQPGITSVILVLFGVPTLSRVVNLVLLCMRRPYLLQGAWQPARGFYRTLLSTGFAFWAIQVGILLEQNGGTFILARMSSTQDTDLFAIVYKYLGLASTPIAILTQPLWPAIADAIAHRDIAWIHRSYARIWRALNLYSAVLALVAIVAGQWIFQRFLHIDTSGHFWMFFILGIYFVVNMQTHLMFVTLMGMQGNWQAAIVLVSQYVLTLLLGIALVPWLGAAGMALAYLLASALLPVWLLPRLMASRMRSITAASHTEASQAAL
jgi:O-antigen/teichoic acid export membrane protein